MGCRIPCQFQGRREPDYVVLETRRNVTRVEPSQLSFRGLGEVEALYTERTEVRLANRACEVAYVVVEADSNLSS